MHAMRISNVSRYAVSICVASVILAGCGGRVNSVVVPLSGISNALPGQHTFEYTGTKQSFKVPPGVTSITVVARGAAGSPDSSSSGSYNDYFGHGSRVYAEIPVGPGETLHVFVGAQGLDSGGFKGGGSPGYPSGFGPTYGGGGASDVRKKGDALRDRILVAAGGGGQGGGSSLNGDGFGGNGGPALGQEGGSVYGAAGGLGGTQNSGGAGGSGGDGSYGGEDSSGDPGALGRGSDGGGGGLDPYCNSSNYGCRGYYGGGGGGGYYGGGGGGGGGGGSYGHSPGAGGGGGSSYAEPSAQRVRMWRGWKNATGDGLVVFSWQPE